MATKSKYVRLSDGASHGICVDMETGWGISGRDVRQIPDVPEIQDFIKSKIRSGVFEEASKAEWDEVHEGDYEDDDDTPVVIMKPERNVPENKLRHRIAKKAAARAAAAEAPEDGDDDGEDEESDLPESIRDLKVAELKAELEARDLDTSGNKEALQERLAEALEDEGDDGEG